MTSWMDTMMRRKINSITDGLSMHYYAVTSWGAKGPSTGFTSAQYYEQLKVTYGDL
ncbi:MAG: hypothetical protein JW863_20510 [Chitinispirillaceae bacterium]|nr:hypothetical protein [Chitinispirillaceae bacterium]